MRRVDRQAALLELLADDGSLDVADVVARFGISAATVRRDLEELAEQQLLTRTHGGAARLSVGYALPGRYNRASNAAAKAQIATRAAALIEPGMTVGLSGGTTTTAIAAALAVRAEALGAKQPVTVVTNAINIAAQLAVRNTVRVVVSGGVANGASFELVGPYSDLVLEQVSIDVAFLGVNAVDAHLGGSVHDEREARVNTLMVSRARDAWIVADASKFGERAFASVGAWSRYRGVITDASIQPEHLRDMEAAGVDVLKGASL